MDANESEPTDQRHPEEDLTQMAGRISQLSAEIDRHRESYSRRSTSMLNRAAMLIGAASISASLTGASGFIGLMVAAYLLLLFAAGLGILALRPRSGGDVNVGSLRDDIHLFGDHQLALALLDQKLKHHDEDEKALNRTARIVKWGFISLAAAIALIGAHVVARHYW